MAGTSQSRYTKPSQSAMLLQGLNFDQCAMLCMTGRQFMQLPTLNNAKADHTAA